MPADNHTAWILSELIRQFAAVVSTMTGAEAEARPEDGAPPEPSATTLTWVQPFDLGGDTILVLSAPQETWRLIGAKPLEAAGLPPEDIDDESARSTFLEILNQTMGAVASAAGAKANRQVLPRDGKETPPGSPLPAVPAAYLPETHSLTLPGTFPLLIHVGVSPGWASAFEIPADGNRADAGAPPAASAESPSSALAQHSRTFDLLLEVELPVTISFGRAMVPLREVAKLTSGSVVELNRTVSDPVEIIVNNCVIARGEVVVIEGNYGVRIQQIISPQERLRTLH
jgi:flagellar motor switch protein FliN